MNASERFWAKVDRCGPDDCWTWTACCKTTGGGYGRACANGKTVGAHRVAYALANGPIPDGLWVLHTCDNPPCCNPAHLWLGTNLDNRRDCVAKGRNARLFGCRNGWARLDDAAVAEARRLVCSGMPHSEVAARLGVSRSAITLAATGKTWPHIGAAPAALRPKVAGLTAEKVIEIRGRRAAGETLARIARDYGVTRQSVSAAVTRQNWAHVA